MNMEILHPIVFLEIYALKVKNLEFLILKHVCGVWSYHC